MTIQQRVERARRVLRAAAIGTAALRGLAAALGVVLLSATVDAFVTLPAGARRTVPALAMAVAAVLFVRRLTRSGARADTRSAALWIEARFPSLRYALVTAVDPRYAGRVPQVEQAAARAEFEPVVRKAARRALAGPAIAVAFGAAALVLLPAGAVGRVLHPAADDAPAPGRHANGANPLGHIVVRVAPPAYAGLRDSSYDDPASVPALVGSRVTVEGAGAGAGVVATLAGSETRAGASGGRWRLTFAMPAAPATVRLLAAAQERLLLLDPATDSAPVVLLTLPERDSILRRPAGRLSLAASAADDYGLASGAFEVIVSSGGGENFTFRSLTLGSTAFDARRGELSATLLLDSLGLRPGDVLHVRAVARDRNTVSGPGVGSSDTRTLRIARAGEYDSVAVDPAPPPEAERNALSQRMLLMLTEALEQRRIHLSRAALVGESRAIAVDQTRLRKRVGEIVLTRLGENSGEEGDAADKRLARPVNPDSVLAAADRAAGAPAGTALEGNEDETPLVATNRPLLEAYNAMWRASGELEIGAPDRAIPFMKAALDALQAARSAERIYLRGTSRAVVVDVDRVRLQGHDTGAPAPRAPRPAVDPHRAERLARFDAARRLLPASPAAAADSLLVLRLDLAGRDTAAARAIEAAANALRAGRDPARALAAARRSLGSPVARPAPLVAWGWPP